MRSKRPYVIIWCATAAAALFLALIDIPYFEENTLQTGAGYFSFIRTVVLLISRLFHSLFLSAHYRFWNANKKLFAVSIALHIILTVLTMPFGIFFWTYI